jgi:hypothetical protein
MKPKNSEERVATMNLIDRICQFTKSTKNDFETDQHHEIETQPADVDVKDEKSSEEVINAKNVSQNHSCFQI